jgi:hypothetical protein
MKKEYTNSFLGMVGWESWRTTNHARKRVHILVFEDGGMMVMKNNQPPSKMSTYAHFQGWWDGGSQEQLNTLETECMHSFFEGSRCWYSSLSLSFSSPSGFQWYITSSHHHDMSSHLHYFPIWYSYIKSLDQFPPFLSCSHFLNVCWGMNHCLLYSVHKLM